MILSNLYFSLWFFILLPFIFIFFFFCKIFEILCVVVAFCVLLLFCFLLFGFFLFWLFCYLGVRFSFSILIFFLIFECENPFKPNYYFCYLSCCCSCLINILGGERFGCLTNSDTMEVESFFFLIEK